MANTSVLRGSWFRRQSVCYLLLTTHYLPCKLAQVLICSPFYTIWFCWCFRMGSIGFSTIFCRQRSDEQIIWLCPSPCTHNFLSDLPITHFLSSCTKTWIVLFSTWACASHLNFVVIFYFVRNRISHALLCMCVQLLSRCMRYYCLFFICFKNIHWNCSSKHTYYILQKFIVVWTRGAGYIRLIKRNK
jgi:hypothetical protein